MESPECVNFKKIIDSNKIVILGTRFCSACVNAKKILNDKKFKFHDVDLSVEEDFQDCLFRTTKSHYVPQIFVNSKYIGGFQELQYLTDSNLLNDLVYKINL